jgi:hypothetical protein
LPASSTDQVKDEADQSNAELSQEEKLSELSALLGGDTEVMEQITKMLNSQGHDIEFVSLKVTETCKTVCREMGF